MSELDKRAKRSREACQVLQNPTAAYDEITRLQSEVERLRGRCAELFSLVADFQKEAWQALGADYVDKFVEQAMKSVLHKAATVTGEADPDDIDPLPFVLREQAEAVEAWLNGGAEMGGLDEYAQRLRNQADELEKDHDPN